MEITRKQRQMAEERASEVQLRLYAEPEAGEQLWNMATKFSLTERSVYYSFTQLVGDVVLGFYKQDDVAALIANKLPQVQGVQKIGLEADIKMFLYPLTDASDLPTKATRNTSVSPEEIAETEKEIASLQTVRTMPHDMEVAQGHPVMRAPATETTYQSSQADILQPTPTVPAPPETPRWDTESKP
jgi:hypothetical protein